MKKIFAMLFPSAGFVSIAPARRTVDGALVYFNKALNELRTVKAQQDAEAEKQVAAIAKAEQDYASAVANAAILRDAAELEARRAVKAIAKIEEFVL